MKKIILKALAGTGWKLSTYRAFTIAGYQFFKIYVTCEFKTPQGLTYKSGYYTEENFKQGDKAGRLRCYDSVTKQLNFPLIIKL